MFNISQISKIMKATNRLNMPTEFNSTLPLTITVKKQLSPIRYLLQLGNKEVEVKSYTKLEIAKKYKAEIDQTNNKIEIKNLSKLPTIFTKMPSTLNYTIDDLIKDNFKNIKNYQSFKDNLEDIKNNILKDDALNDNKNYKHFLLHHLASSTSKDEFIFFTQLLLAENQQIKHLFINEKKKRALMQLKYKKNKLKFYAFFENLGAISGEMFLTDTIYLNLMVEFQKSLTLISQNIDKLKGISVNITQEKVKPLFEISENNLLNIKG
jgi:hypothetical protein